MAYTLTSNWPCCFRKRKSRGFVQSVMSISFETFRKPMTEITDEMLDIIGQVKGKRNPNL